MTIRNHKILCDVLFVTSILLVGIIIVSILNVDDPTLFAHPFMCIKNIVSVKKEPCDIYRYNTYFYVIVNAEATLKDGTS